MSVPYKLLEINIVSAQDLPPVSKMLRTFVVAWVNPDNKLTTRVDHHGHTNPTWNYKLVFRVDDNFLRSEASAVSIEIYNVAWLRDLPIGTTRLLINHISPPLTNKHPTMRSVALHIRRPSGHLQGILNVGVNLIGDDTIPSPPPDSESNPSTISKLEIVDDQVEEFKQEHQRFDWKEEEEKIQQKDSRIQMLRSKSNRIESPDEDISPIRGSIIWSQSESDEKSKVISPNNSLYSAMRPLPTEVALDLKKGFYSTAGNDIGSSIFDNWTVPGASEINLKSKSVRREVDDQINLLAKDGDQKKRRSHRKKHSSDKRGLMSCFGNAYGFEFTFICGSKNIKKSRKKKHDQRTFPSDHPQENLRTFYI